MNLSWNNFTKDTTTSAPTLSQEVARRLLLFYIIQTAAYIVLSSVALFGNTLVILVFVFDRRLLKKSYNILILSLVVSDVLSAVIVIMTHVANHYFLPSNPVYGAIFCKIIATFFFPWQFLFFSVYICLLLSVERWIAIVKPHKYSSIFRRKNVAGCILASWVTTNVLGHIGYGIQSQLGFPVQSQHHWQRLLGQAVCRCLPGDDDGFLSLPCHDWLVHSHDRFCKFVSGCVSGKQG